MNVSTYTRYELLRGFRNRRFVFFSLGFPLALYWVIAGSNSSDNNFGGSGLSAPLYYMAGLASFGTMNAMLSSGARIAGERAVGWNRQLRISPLSAVKYLRTKVISGYLMASATIVLLYVSAVSLGVSMPAAHWLEMTGLIFVGLIPFAAAGIFIGHKITVDSIGPVMGGTTAVLAFVSGTWFPVPHHGFLHDLAQVLPSYWLVQAGRVGSGGHTWPARAWLVVAVWTLVMGVLAARAFRSDTERAT